MERDEVQRIMDLRLRLMERLQAIRNRMDEIQERVYMPDVPTKEFIGLRGEYNNLVIERGNIENDLKTKYKLKKNLQ